jgi:hypothetical protein
MEQRGQYSPIARNEQVSEELSQETRGLSLTRGTNVSLSQGQRVKVGLAEIRTRPIQAYNQDRRVII